MKRLFTILSILLVFSLVVCKAFATSVKGAKQADARRVAVVIDQSPGLVMDMDSDVLAELVLELDAKTSDLVLTVVNPKEDGALVRRDGKEVSMNDFDVLWIYREYSLNDESITALPAFVNKLKVFVSQKDHGIVLTGYSCTLFEQFGYGKLKFKLHMYERGRHQAGIVPYQPNAPLFAGTISDRGMISMTHATYHVYREFSTDSKNVISYATTNEPWRIPLLAGLAPFDGDKKRTDIIVFPWSINFVYQDAESEFRHNFETLSLNLVRQAGRVFNEADITPPAFTLPVFAPLRRALNDLIETWEDDYPKGKAFLKSLNALEKRGHTVKTKDEADLLCRDFAALQKEALLANPEFDFDELLFIRRSADKSGFPANFNGNASIKPTGYANELLRFNFRSGKTSLVYKPSNDEFVGDIDLHFDANRLLLSMPDAKSDLRWRLWEIQIDPDDASKTSVPKKITTIEEMDVDNYDACYLPDDRIIFCSTACFTGVPCTNGAGHICNLYQRKVDGTVRQLTIEQDHDWCPTVMNNGRIMYLRWEYTSLPHAYSRILFHANPDGSNQTELYGSGSWWPLAMFYARPVPNHPTKFVAITTGHHEVHRIGDLVLFDPGRGRQNTEGAIQRIPGWGKKVNSVPLDCPIRRNWPKFVHPYPISDKYFIVSCKRTETSPWELCLVDVFDNIVTLREEVGVSLYEPIPLRKTPKPPIIPDRITPPKTDADVFIADVYAGEGLKGVNRGVIKSLRIFSYHFAYQGMGAEPHSVGLDGPWDPKRIIGTVPVCEDGSVSFKIPANVPIAFQTLDAEGKAVQNMRSWVTAMPGELLSCVGCHEKQNTTSPPMARTEAAQKPPVNITPFYGPARGLSFHREIQPILNHYCVECHRPDSQKTKKLFADSGKYKNGEKLPVVPDFRDGPIHPAGESKSRHVVHARFTTAYMQLRQFVHTATKESQMTILKPYQFHADSTRLIQVLQQGHYGVTLDSVSWDRLVTWIDLDSPFHANWGDLRNYEEAQHVSTQWKRRADMRKLYTQNAVDLDESPMTRHPVYPVVQSDKPDPRNEIFKDIDDLPVADPNSKVFKEAQVESVPIAEGLILKLVSIPGTNYRLGQFEITNEQYRFFDPKHDSGVECGDVCIFGTRAMGFLLSRPKQPVTRVTWDEANAFCQWLSQKTGRKFALPTASQWEYAASAGTKTPFWFGGEDVDFSLKENLADLCLWRVASFDYLKPTNDFVSWRPSDKERNDRSRVSAPVGSYQSNPWKLYDMHGNVAEWTSSESRNSTGEIKKLVCGGSWYTPPKEASIKSRRRFRPYVNIFDVGFRVCEQNALK